MDHPHLRLSMIAAVDRHLLIGVDSLRMPWHLPDDLRHFKRLTMGKPMIMGRRTFESIGRPLPGRLNLVVTRGHAIAAIDGLLQTAPSLADARRVAEDWVRRRAGGSTAPADPEVMVIGGAQIYTQALPDADRLYLTEIDRAYDGNVHFPDFRQLQPGWVETAREPHRGQGDPDPAYAFVTYERAR